MWPIFDHHLTNKARAVWRRAAVIRGSDGTFTLLKRNGEDPVCLTPPVNGGLNTETFKAARSRLYELRSAAGLGKTQAAP